MLGSIKASLSLEETQAHALNRSSSNCVTHVSGTLCHLCLGPLKPLLWTRCFLIDEQPSSLGGIFVASRKPPFVRDPSKRKLSLANAALPANALSSLHSADVGRCARSRHIGLRRRD